MMSVASQPVSGIESVPSEAAGREGFDETLHRLFYGRSAALLVDASN
jgi:hypothetical protein